MVVVEGREKEEARETNGEGRERGKEEHIAASTKHMLQLCPAPERRLAY